ncbi:MAG: FkbM family methyltransferase [Acidimicrobiia bacterium]|nr:FkbM family methyltransferase [Acidimicrobiia bacterium]
MSRYEVTWALMRPVTAMRRRQTKRRLGDVEFGTFEANHYRPSFARFRAAALVDPSLLLDANLDGGVILDVGGFEGGWSNRLVRHIGDTPVRILAFEPVPMMADKWRPTDPRVELHRVGLAGSDRTEKITLAGQGSTIFGAGTFEIQMRDVDNLLRTEGVERVDLAKVNIEGGEYELIDRMHATGLLDRTRTLIIQFHDFVPGAHRLRRRARRLLEETHECTWCYPWVYERWDHRPAATSTPR